MINNYRKIENEYLKCFSTESIEKDKITFHDEKLPGMYAYIKMKY